MAQNQWKTIKHTETLNNMFAIMMKLDTARRSVWSLSYVCMSVCLHVASFCTPRHHYKDWQSGSFCSFKRHKEMNDNLRSVYVKVRLCSALWDMGQGTKLACPSSSLSSIENPSFLLSICLSALCQCTVNSSDVSLSVKDLQSFSLFFFFILLGGLKGSQ